jgi:hypothetical protein
MKKVLYIGSGNSALLAKNKDLSEYTIVCANNAWKIFENSKFDCWVHSGDFPKENFPTVKNYDTKVSFNEYTRSAKNILSKLNIRTRNADHHLGYTIFFMGLYWIIDTLQPSEIHTLGFDHDYNEKKVQKWFDSGKPNPQNHFLKNKNQSIKDWSNNFFSSFETDFFYGHGTPDPLRLGDKHLLNKFIQAINYSEKLNVKLYNISNVDSKLNIFPKIKNKTFYDVDNIIIENVSIDNEILDKVEEPIKVIVSLPTKPKNIVKENPIKKVRTFFEMIDQKKLKSSLQKNKRR